MARSGARPSASHSAAAFRNGMNVIPNVAIQNPSVFPSKRAKDAQAEKESIALLQGIIRKMTRQTGLMAASLHAGDVYKKPAQGCAQSSLKAGHSSSVGQAPCALFRGCPVSPSSVCNLHDPPPTSPVKQALGPLARHP